MLVSSGPIPTQDQQVPHAYPVHPLRMNRTHQRGCPAGMPKKNDSAPPGHAPFRSPSHGLLPHLRRTRVADRADLSSGRVTPMAWVMYSASRIMAAVSAGGWWAVRSISSNVAPILTAGNNTESGVTLVDVVKHLMILGQICTAKYFMVSGIKLRLEPQSDGGALTSTLCVTNNGQETMAINNSI